MLTKRASLKLATALAALMVVGSAQAAEKLRLLTWADYVPKDVMDQFTKETGIEVEVTLSNNEEMISKLPGGETRRRLERIVGGDGWEVNGYAVRAAFAVNSPVAGTRLVKGHHVRIR